MQYMPSIELINMQKLAILGIQKEHVYAAVLMLGIFITYFILRPVIQWLLLKNSYKLLTYVISSLSILVLLFFSAYIIGDGGGMDFTLLIKYTLLTLTMFGLALLTVNLMHFVFRKWFKKSV